MIKNILHFLVLIFSVIVMNCAGNSVCVITPNYPQLNDEITVNYYSNSYYATLKNSEAIECQAIIIREIGDPILIERKLKYGDGKWETSFKLTDEKSRMIIFRFSDGDSIDNNNDQGWDILIHGVDKKPLRNAHLSKVDILCTPDYYGFKCRVNFDLAKEEIKKEQELYPENSFACKLKLLQVMLLEDNNNKQIVEKEITKIYDSLNNNIEQKLKLVTLFYMIDKSEIVKKIYQEDARRNPSGEIAKLLRETRVHEEENRTKKIELIKKFMKDFSLDTARTNFWLSLLAINHFKTENFENSIESIKAMSEPHQVVFETINALIERKYKLPELQKILKNWVTFSDNHYILKKESYISTKDFIKMNNGILGTLYDSYSNCIYSLGETKEALIYSQKAYYLLEEENPDVTKRYIMLLLANSENKQAMNVSASLIKRGEYDEQVISYYRTSFINAYNTDKGLNENIESLKEASSYKIKEKSMNELWVNKDAISFNLKTLDGASIKLSDLKGKVVLLDFWATWCGPCVASFPTLQKLHEKYKANDQVTILTVNCAESKKGKDREELLKNFVQKNQYTLPVLLDIDTFEKYEVTGWPTKFIIGKDGRIYFKSIGFENSSKMMNELTTQIELLLDDKFYLAK